ncbi:ABC-type transport auxiliary lipoprotein family protein [Chitinibacteraceae bacterium HSL-7]
MKRLLTLALISLLLGGCAARPDVERYQLAPATHSASPTQLPGTLYVRAFAAADMLRDTGFIYRESDYRYARDPYRQFVAPPAQLLTEAVTRALTKSQLFALVTTDPGALSEWQLGGRVEQLYTDLRPEHPVSVTVALRMTLQHNGTLVDERVLEASAPVKQVDGDGISAAASAATAQILGDYQAWLTRASQDFVR